MSLFRDAVIAKLVCPKCQAANRRGATYIELDDHNIACCGVCTKSGPLKDFQPEHVA